MANRTVIDTTPKAQHQGEQGQAEAPWSQCRSPRAAAAVGRESHEGPDDPRSAKSPAQAECLFARIGCTMRGYRGGSLLFGRNVEPIGSTARSADMAVVALLNPCTFLVPVLGAAGQRGGVD